MFAACLPAILHPPPHLQPFLPPSCVDMSSSSTPFRYNSSSGSQSPTSPSTSIAASSNPSPASNSLMLSRLIDSGDVEQNSSIHEGRGASTRTNDSLRSPTSAVRGGCWTCRIRRKKCDEDRIGESCRTCIRLKIDCLGWGTRKPDWMKDKAAVEEYKAGIKAKLNQAGMIRGVPRTPAANVVTSSSFPSISSTSQSSRRQEQNFLLPGALGPGPPGIEGTTPPPLDYFHHGGSYSHTSSPLPLSTHDSSHSSTQRLSPMGYSSTSLSSSFVSVPQPPRIAINTSHYISSPNLTDHGYDNSFEALTITSAHSSTPSDEVNPMPLTSVEGQHVFHYFNSVLPVQYIFAAHNLTNLIHDIIVREPLGAVTNANCALASLHHQKSQMARGIQYSRSPSEQSPAEVFYDRAFWQIANSRVIHNRYSETDAVAALQLISYWLFSGGLGNWLMNLDIACEWLAQSHVNSEENPLMAILRFTPTAKFAVQTTMWMDIISSISLRQAPRFLELYQRLLRGGSEYWANDDYNLHMDGLMGCPDEIMLAFAEISALAHWKVTERQNGTLSVRELVRRGNEIEEQLQRRQHARTPTEQGLSPSERGRITDTAQYNMMLSPTHYQYSPQQSVAASSSYNHMLEPSHNSLPVSKSELQQIYHETALLYLYSVVNEANPCVPEIRRTTNHLIHLINELPPTLVDRTLILPMFLAGCLSNQTNERDIIRQRLLAQDETFGNVKNARLLMQSVWQRRDSQGVVEDWQTVMCDMGMNLLLA